MEVIAMNRKRRNIKRRPFELPTYDQFLVERHKRVIDLLSTPHNCVYIIAFVYKPEIVKIGRTEWILGRLLELTRGHPVSIQNTELHFCHDFPTMVDLEDELLDTADPYRLSDSVLRQLKLVDGKSEYFWSSAELMANCGSVISRHTPALVQWPPRLEEVPELNA